MDTPNQGVAFIPGSFHRLNEHSKRMSTRAAKRIECSIRPARADQSTAGAAPLQSSAQAAAQHCGRCTRASGEVLCPSTPHCPHQPLRAPTKCARMHSVQEMASQSHCGSGDGSVFKARRCEVEGEGRRVSNVAGGSGVQHSSGQKRLVTRVTTPHHISPFEAPRGQRDKETTVILQMTTFLHATCQKGYPCLPTLPLCVVMVREQRAGPRTFFRRSQETT